MLTLEKVIILKSVEIFQALPEEHLVELAGILRAREVHAGETIIREGDIGTSLFVIVEGKVRVHRQEKEVAVLGSRDVFGELAALDPEPRSATITALEETRLFELDGEALYELMADRIEAARGIFRVLCRRLRAELKKAY
jgi:CRP-like cAMP-binding protein